MNEPFTAADLKELIAASHWLHDNESRLTEAQQNYAFRLRTHIADFYYHLRDGAILPTMKVSST